ncbi:MAG: pantoate--beta-alanine ligase [Candidatus Omnitrophota bacterium]
MKIITTIKAMRRAVDVWRQQGRSVGFVPTMGYFHDGHISLMKASVKDNDRTVVSLFVNPTQFGPQEDLLQYPRDIARDKLAARSAGVDVLFVPVTDEMYPQMKTLTWVEVEGIGDILCGASRPGHFRGVATVVSKLLNIVQPDVMYLGQKDAQQAALLKKMVSDLNFPVCVKVCPTLREEGGLAMSSRNSYLSASEKTRASVIFRALCHAAEMIADGEREVPKINSSIKKLICDGAGASIDYVACIRLDGFQIARRIEGDTLIAVAVRIGSTRLIDNIVVKV